MSRADFKSTAGQPAAEAAPAVPLVVTETNAVAATVVFSQPAAAGAAAAASETVKADAKEHTDYEACIKNQLEKLKIWNPKAEQLVLIESNLRHAIVKKLVRQDEFNHFDGLGLMRVFGTVFGFATFCGGCFTLAEFRALNNPLQYGVIIEKNIELLNGDHEVMYARFKALRAKEPDLFAGGVVKNEDWLEGWIQKQLNRVKASNSYQRTNESKELGLIEWNLRNVLTRKFVGPVELDEINVQTLKRVFGTYFGFAAFCTGSFTLAEIQSLDERTQHGVLIDKNIELLNNSQHAALYAKFKALQQSIYPFELKKLEDSPLWLVFHHALDEFEQDCFTLKEIQSASLRLDTLVLFNALVNKDIEGLNTSEHAALYGKFKAFHTKKSTAAEAVKSASMVAAMRVVGLTSGLKARAPEGTEETTAVLDRKFK